MKNGDGLMQERIHKIEQDVAIVVHTQESMSKSLEKISNSLERISQTQGDIQILNEKIRNLNKETEEAFVRADKRMTKVEGVITRIAWMFIAPMIAAILGTYFKG